jgi:glycerol-3-phosphate dehydrogenase
VVNAAGVWSDDVRAMDEGHHPDSIRPAKGIHITVPWHKVRNTVAAVIPVPKDRRSVFVVPQGEFTYIGTTDTDYDGPVDDPQCTREDIDYLLSAINGASTEQLTVDDIVGTWDTIVDDVLTLRPGATQVGASVTKKLRLRGAAGFDTLDATTAAYPSIGAELRTHLGGRYGGEARVLMAAIEEDPALGEPIVPGLPYVRAEVVFAVRHEMANSVSDVLSRRTRAQLFARDDSADAAGAVAELMAAELDWTPEQAAESVDEYRAAVAHERDAAGLPETHLTELIGADA